VLVAEPTRAEDLEAGKAPSAIFAADCAGCHRSPRGLAKTMNSRSALSAFLREHYTTGSGLANELSTYLLGLSGGDERRSPRPPALGEVAPRPGDKPTRRRSQEAVIPPQTVPPAASDRTKRRWRAEPPAQAATDPARRPAEGNLGTGNKARPGRHEPERAQNTGGTSGRQPAADAGPSDPERPAVEAADEKRQPAPVRGADTQPETSSTGAPESRREPRPEAVPEKRDATSTGTTEIKPETLPAGAAQTKRDAGSADTGAETAGKPQGSTVAGPASRPSEPPAPAGGQPPGRGDQSAFSAPSP
jgi:hypothetical protein